MLQESDTLKFTVTLQQKSSDDIVRLPISVIILDENDNAPIFKHTPYEGSVGEESQIGTTVFKWIHVEDSDKVGDPLEVRCESNLQVIYELYTKIFIYSVQDKEHSRQLATAHWHGFIIKSSLINSILGLRDNNSCYLTAMYKNLSLCAVFLILNRV